MEEDYTVLVKGTIALLVLLPLLLTGCLGQGGSAPAPADTVSGGKSAVVSTDLLGTLRKHTPRPSATLGIYASMYLAQGLFVSTESALHGISSLLKILEAQEKPLSDDAFALLGQLETTMNINIVDTLNRSTNRVETLDQYSTALKNITENSKRKNAELQASATTLEEQQKTQRQTVRDLEKEIQKAIDAKDFTTAGSKQGELTKAETALNETEFKQKQTNDMLERFKKLIEGAERRQNAIDSNREILIAGLQITDPQGLVDLGVVTEN